jgi:putative sigma-54 modulation protein
MFDCKSTLLGYLSIRSMNRYPNGKPAAPTTASRGAQGLRVWTRALALPPFVCVTLNHPMNNPNNTHELIVSGIHLELTPSLKTYVREKAERLFRHEERIVRIRVELECDRNQNVETKFVAKGHIHIHGPDMNCSVQSDDCHKSIDLLVDKLDRMLARRAKYYKVRRHQLHPVELENVALPKAV